MQPPTYADILAAEPVVRRYLKPTPLYEWPALAKLLGCRYYLKHENHTPTTAFKVRGGIYLVSRLSEEQKQRDQFWLDQLKAESRRDEEVLSSDCRQDRGQYPRPEPAEKGRDDNGGIISDERKALDRLAANKLADESRGRHREHRGTICEQRILTHASRACDETAVLKSSNERHQTAPKPDL